MKILLAQDGSETSLRAVRHLIAHLRWFREQPEINLVFVHPPIPIDFASKHVSEAALDAYYREEGEAALAGARRLLDEGGIAYKPYIRVGPVAESVVHLARDLGCDLIAMGTHGRGALGNALIGSVATKVLHLSALPVMLAK